MKTQQLLTLTIGAPLILAMIWALLKDLKTPKKIPVRVKKNQPRK